MELKYKYISNLTQYLFSVCDNKVKNELLEQNNYTSFSTSRNRDNPIYIVEKSFKIDTESLNMTNSEYDEYVPNIIDYVYETMKLIVLKYIKDNNIAETKYGQIANEIDGYLEIINKSINGFSNRDYYEKSTSILNNIINLKE